MAVYNPSGTVGNKWETGIDVIGNASIVFNVTDTGQVQFSTSTLSGIGHNGVISFSAVALKQSY